MNIWSTALQGAFGPDGSAVSSILLSSDRLPLERCVFEVEMTYEGVVIGETACCPESLPMGLHLISHASLYFLDYSDQTKLQTGLNSLQQFLKTRNKTTMTNRPTFLGIYP